MSQEERIIDKCPICGRDMTKRLLGGSPITNSGSIMPYDERIIGKCPICGGDIIKQPSKGWSYYVTE